MPKDDNMVYSIEVGKGGRIVRCNAGFTTARNVRLHEGRDAAGAAQPGTSQHAGKVVCKTAWLRMC